MDVGAWYWLTVFLTLIFGGFGLWGPTPYRNYFFGGFGLVLLILFVLIGFRVMGAPIR